MYHYAHVLKLTNALGTILENQELADNNVVGKTVEWTQADGSKLTAVVALSEDATPYTGKIDEDWVLKSKTDKYIDSVSFVAKTASGKFSSLKSDMVAGTEKYIKVALVDELDSTSDVEVDFEVWVKEGSAKSNVAAFDGALMANEQIIKIYAGDDEEIFDVEDRIVVSAKGRAKDVIFDFGDDVYFVNTVVKGEKFVMNLSTSYDKEIDKAYNEYDADLSFYNFQGSNDAFTKTGELFIPAEEETFIYEIVDGAIVEVEATYVTDEDILGMDIEDGWKIETKELGYYVVADEELVVAEEEVEAKPEVEADKANPETGAADFVGAAVAMAVVSVAAAGALALKK